MHRDRDFDVQRQLPAHEPALTQDLALDTLFDAMALGDKFLREVAQVAVLSGIGDDLGDVLHRQAVLRDCLDNASIVRDLYALAVEAIEGEKKAYFYSYFSKHSDAILNRAIEVLQMFVGMLKKLRTVADRHAAKFASERRAAARTQIAAALAQIAVLAERFDLPVAEDNLGATIAAHMSADWANLCDTRSAKLRRYGEVDSRLAEFLDADVDALAQLALSLAALQRDDPAP